MWTRDENAAVFLVKTFGLVLLSGRQDEFSSPYLIVNKVFYGDGVWCTCGTLSKEEKKGVQKAVSSEEVLRAQEKICI